MRFTGILLLMILLTASLQAQSHSECEKFEVVAVYDFPPTPQTPGGNHILLLLTVNETLAPGFNPFYADLFFVEANNDTITIPLGANQTLPVSTSDTIPYIMVLDPHLGISDFPNPFSGQLVIRTPNASPFPNPTVCHVDYNKAISPVSNLANIKSAVKVSPNPFQSSFTVSAPSEIQTIFIFNQLGALIQEVPGQVNSSTIQVSVPPSGTGRFYLWVRLKNGAEIIQPLIQQP